MLNKGFSLLELLVVLALVGIVFGFGLLEFKQINQAYKQKRVGNQLLNLLKYCRGVAIVSGQQCFFCATKDLLSCSKTATNKVIVYQLDENDEYLYLRRVTLPLVNELAWHGFANSNAIIFNADGFAKYNGGLFYMLAGQTKSAKIIINQLGGMKMSEPFQK